MHRQKLRIEEQVGHLPTFLDSAPRAPKPQVPGAIPVPPVPRKPEFKGCDQVTCRLFFMLLTPLDPNGSIAGSHVNDVYLVLNVLVQQNLQPPRLSQ
jgi:hypothetical protein